MRPSPGSWAFAVVAVLAPSPGAGQDVRVSVPLEYTSGFYAGDQRPASFTGGFRSALLARLGSDANVLVGPAGAWSYDGGEWGGVLGVRAGCRLPGLGLRDAGVFVVADALTGNGRRPLSLTVMADLPVAPALFARFGASVTRDLERGQTGVALMIGVDLARVAIEIFRGGGGPHVVGSRRSMKHRPQRGRP